MPPVPSGRTVALIVSLPADVRSPGTSVPPLEWVEVQGRWVGTARLTEWPDAVVVSPARGWLAARSVVTAAAAVITADCRPGDRHLHSAVAADLTRRNEMTRLSTRTAGLRLFAERAPQHLADHRLGQLGPELDP